MEVVKILGVDASLRNTGLAIVSYNVGMPISNPKAFSVTNCQVLRNPAKFTGTDAILNMLDMMHDEAQKKCYKEVSQVLVESPPVLFNKEWGAGTISSIAHISGGAVAIFGIEKAHLFRPNEWNKSRKKGATHNQTAAFLGDPENWHYEEPIKSEKYLEHILDAASMALWWLKNNYLDE